MEMVKSSSVMNSATVATVDNDTPPGGGQAPWKIGQKEYYVRKVQGEPFSVEDKVWLPSPVVPLVK